jgi:uncharacterized protein (DUF1778 family)
MPPRRERPFPNLPISLEALPPPETKRTRRLNLTLAKSEMARIEAAARERDEEPTVFCRTVVLTALQISAAMALGQKPGILELPTGEQQKALLEAFDFKSPQSGKHQLPSPPASSKVPTRTFRINLSFTESEMAVIDGAARERGEQPSVLARTLVLTAIQNSADRARSPKADARELTPAEIQKALLEAFSFEE